MTVRLLSFGVTTLLPLVMAASTARAQERFFTMADLTGGNHVAARTAVGIAYTRPYETERDQGLVFRPRILISTFQPEGAVALGDFSVVGILPMTNVSGRSDASGVGLGNPTVAVLYRRVLAADEHRVVAGGGVVGSLGLASSETASAVSAFFYQDLGRFWRHGHTARVHADGAWQHRRLFAQLELGVDTHVADTDGYGPYTQSLARVALGAGVRPRPCTALFAELTTLSDVLDRAPAEAAGGKRFVQSLELGVRWNGQVDVGAELFVPFHRDISSDYIAEFGLGLELGIPL